MTEIETDVFDKVARAALAVEPSLYVTSVYVTAPSAFPAMWLRMVSDDERLDMVSSSPDEEGSTVTFEGQFYADGGGARQLCRRVAAAADAKMRELGFTRRTLMEYDNQADPSVTRYVGRWAGTVTKSDEIYGR